MYEKNTKKNKIIKNENFNVIIKKRTIGKLFSCLFTIKYTLNNAELFSQISFSSRDISMLVGCKHFTCDLFDFLENSRHIVDNDIALVKS